MIGKYDIIPSLGRLLTTFRHLHMIQGDYLCFLTAKAMGYQKTT